MEASNPVAVSQETIDFADSCYGRQPDERSMVASDPGAIALVIQDAAVRCRATDNDQKASVEIVSDAFTPGSSQ
jgi:hypothetical protein